MDTGISGVPDVIGTLPEAPVPARTQGLGKTAQSIATLAFLRQFLGIRGPHIVIAPLTTLGHWQREIETWTGMVGALRCLIRPQ